MFIAFHHATLFESLLDPSLAITTPSFVDIMVLSLLIELDRVLICVSKRISKYADTATAKPLFTIKLINSLTSMIITSLYWLYVWKQIISCLSINNYFSKLSET
jgi:hypothetical protein